MTRRPGVLAIVLIATGVALGCAQHSGPRPLPATAVRAAADGATRPEVAMSLTSLTNLAMRYWAQGAYAKALPLVARVAEIREAQLRLELALLSGPRKRALMMLLQKETDSVVSLHADAMPSNPQALELALTTVLRRKGRGLDPLADDQLGLRAPVAQIRAALPPGAALVEFVRYHRFDPRQSPPQQEARYVAYILPWDGPAQAVALGEAAPIDAAVDAEIAAMYMGTGTGVARAALRDLDTLVFAPLRDPLTNISHVFLALDDKLNLVPFEALSPPQRRHELERRLVSYVTSGRDLLRLATHRAPRSSATIVAALDHGPPSSPAHNGLGTFAGAAPIVNAASQLAHAGVAPTPTTPLPPPDLEQSIYVDGDACFRLPPSPVKDPIDPLDRASLALTGATVGPDGIVKAQAQG